MAKPHEKCFTILEHEADIGIESYGKDQAELFVNTAHALFSLITNTGAVGAGVKRHITVTNGEELLVVFLNELLYLWDTEHFIPGDISLIVEGGRVDAEVAGEIFDPIKHSVFKEVKAVTYHKFSVRHEGGQLQATIFLDV